jgi:hypothetical protein
MTKARIGMGLIPRPPWGVALASIMKYKSSEVALPARHVPGRSGG